MAKWTFEVPSICVFEAGWGGRCTGPRAWPRAWPKKTLGGCGSCFLPKCGALDFLGPLFFCTHISFDQLGCRADGFAFGTAAESLVHLAQAWLERLEV